MSWGMNCPGTQGGDPQETLLIYRNVQTSAGLGAKARSLPCELGLHETLKNREAHIHPCEGFDIHYRSKFLLQGHNTSGGRDGPWKAHGLI